MMMDRSRTDAVLIVFGLLLVFALSCGCASQKVDALTQKLADQQRQIGILQKENIEIKSRIEEQKTGYYLVDKRLKDSNDRMADISSRLQSLELAMGEVKGNMEEIMVSSARRPSVAPSPAETAAPAGDLSAKESAALMEAKATAPGGGAMGSQELYNQALKTLQAGEPGQAVLEFEKYIREFPHSELADNAQYWIGEAFYVQKEYNRALTEFQKLSESYPQGDKVPDAILKAGMCYLEMGQKEKGKAELRRLVSRYPNSAPANLARKKLAELRK